ncbi:transmembrane protein, putative [Entamoeba invadens IP1]|uniref:Transmembrane protein, putative n=1 Tax=Entamoeba invadens IP1 TaxID=370355 RepID=A0A0A1UAA0_ENTIV|nr:transmembrane protein, putative [Entamoeba invadens IP1]ELP91947.1 transmembrane protein, putative [Entamoeba invadens IP1]|eukprot:XP_004258718.1 transmembrane protein, putative [Entamoeba invadens IP1]
MSDIKDTPSQNGTELMEPMADGKDTEEVAHEDVVQENAQMEEEIHKMSSTTTTTLQNKEVLVPLIQVVSYKVTGIVFFIFLLLVIGSLIGTVYIPSPFTLVSGPTWQCTCPTRPTVFDPSCCYGDLLQQNTISMDIGPFTELNEEFRLSGVFVTTNKVKFNTKLQLKMTINGTDDARRNYELYKDYRYDATLNCHDLKCDEITFFTYHILSFRYYNVTLTLVEPVEDAIKAEVGEMTYSLRVVNKKYTLSFVIWRFVFVLVSCVVTGLFTIFSRKYPFDNWPFENKSVFVLLLVLIFLNNPFYTYQFVFGGVFFVFLDMVVTAFFCVYVLMEVLIVFEALRKPISWRTQLGFWIGRIMFFIAFFIVILVTLLYNEGFNFTNPTYAPLKDKKNIVFSCFVGVFVLMYIGWLLFSVIRTFSEAKKVGNAKRVIAFGVLMFVAIFIFVVLLIVAFFLGFENSATTYLATISYANFFVYLLAFFYLPTPSKKLWNKAKAILVKTEDITQYKELQTTDYTEHPSFVTAKDGESSDIED